MVGVGVGVAAAAAAGAEGEDRRQGEGGTGEEGSRSHGRRPGVVGWCAITIDRAVRGLEANIRTV